MTVCVVLRKMAKMNTNRLLIVLSCLFSHALSKAQVFYSVTDTVIIIAARELPFSIQPDTFNHQADKAADLQFLTAVSINALSLSGLATLSSRGMSAKHTGVLFDGIPINNITTGVTDVSLLPFSYFSKSRLLKEGMVASFGDHTLGGALSLNPEFNGFNHITAASRYNTANNRDYELNSRFRIGNTGIGIFLEEINHNNNISFFKNNERLKSPAFMKKGRNVNFDLAFSPHPKHKFSLAAWHQQFHRNLPGPFFNYSGQSQQDLNNRFSLVHSFISASSVIRSQLALLDEQIIFKAPGVYSVSNTRLIQISSAASWKSGLQLSATGKIETANTNFYSGPKSRSNLMLVFGKRWDAKTIKIQALVAPHFLSDGGIPVNAEVRINRKSFGLAAIRNYNLPGFNDLFWPSGGNPGLKPEQSHQLSLHHSVVWRKNWQISSSLYSYWVDNFIQWVPGQNAIWSPFNLKKVWSRGGDLKVSFQWKYRQIHTIASVQYTLTKSTSQFAQQPYTSDKQLIYIPLHKVVFFHNTQLLNWQFSGNAMYLGKRYDSTDNFSFLPSLWVFGIQMNYLYKYKNGTLMAELSIDNLTNKDYQLIRSFPLPARNFTFQISSKYNLP